MPAATEPDQGADSSFIHKFHHFGLSESKANDVARNPKIARALDSIISAEGLDQTTLPPKQVALILSWATCASKLDAEKLRYGAQSIVDGRLKTSAQVDAAFAHLQSIKGSIDKSAFEQSCGVGAEVSRENTILRVDDLIASSQLAKTQQWSAFGKVLAEVKKDAGLRWAAPVDIKDATELTFARLFGPKTQVGPSKVAASTGGKVGDSANTKGKAKSVPGAKPDEPSIFEVGMLSTLHKPSENLQQNPDLMAEHLRSTGNKVITRFPPEPNGFLHIGRRNSSSYSVASDALTSYLDTKAIAIDFGFAAFHGGHCNLRYDDTNPEAEEQVYFDSILEIVRWLGFEPANITYSSDHFVRLHELAVELIKRDKAYVCFCTGAEIKANRGGEERGPRKACSHRSSAMTESLAAFEKMKSGGFAPNEAVLRMKQDLEDGNPQMWDLVAYRVLDAAHHRTGATWKIYPTYDFTHCLVDSFENITHSLCTTEFIQSRVSYEWLCHALDVYTPRQTEFGRLRLEGTITSKRKILKLVRDGHVEGWDDPRLYTLIALKRRGVPAKALLKFINGLGVSTAITTISTHRFDQAVRQYLEMSTPRLMMLLNPIRLTLTNLSDDFVLFLDRNLHPKVPEMGKILAPFTRHLYIDRSDFRLESHEDFYRLTVGGTVGLLQVPHPVTCTSVKKDAETGEVVELICRYEDGPSPPQPKAYIQWVATHAPSSSPVQVDETRIYKPFFKSVNPAAADDFIADINPDTLVKVQGAMVEVGFWEVAFRSLREAQREAVRRSEPVTSSHDASHHDATRTPDHLVGLECVRFQGMRTAYFTIDKTAQVDCLRGVADLKSSTSMKKVTGDRLVLNFIVSLKEDSGKSL